MHFAPRLGLPPVLAFCTLAVCMASCGDPTPEQVADDTVGVMDEMSAALEKVTSKETAQKAVEKFKSLVPRMKKLAEQFKSMEKSMEKPTAELKAKYQAQLAAAGMRLQAAMAKLQEYPEQMQAIQNEMKDVDLR